MARNGDKGPYSVDNVRIVLMETNLDERKLPRGSKHAGAKLTEDDVREIRRLDGKMKRKDVAAKFGVSYWHVRDIQKGKCLAWTWLE